MSAQARISHNQSDDLFYDRNWVYDRPRVDSDYRRSSDMLPYVPLFFNNDADMFDHANNAPNTYGGEDMLPQLQIPLQLPQTIMTMDPPQGPYMAR